MQTTLDKFLMIEKKRRSVFYVDWTAPQPCAQWLTNVPERIDFSATVKWREASGMNLTVCCRHADDHKPFDFTSVSDASSLKFSERHLFLIKSHLQKCIRRLLTVKAIETAFVFAQLDLSGLVRRLSVIMIEDVALDASMTVLSWLVAALSKGYLMSQPQIEWLLGVTRWLSDYPASDRRSRDSPDALEPVKMIKAVDDATSVSNANKDVLYSLLFRASYGGLKCDTKMFYDYAAIWLHRFIQGRELDRREIVSCLIHSGSVKNLNVSDIELSSIDYHCYIQIIKHIKQKHPECSDAEIRRTIWHCSSKINLRYPEGNAMTSIVWKAIGADVIQFQKDIVQSLMKSLNA